MAASPVICEQRASAFWIILNRPDQRNSLNNDVLRGIADGLRTARGQTEVRAIVLTGAGERAFCAGADLRSATDGPLQVDLARSRNPLLDLFDEFEACSLPTIARVNGDALGGGMGLLGACDLAIAADHATLGVPETGVGLFPMIILPYLQRTMPRRKLLEWCITGARWSADEAFQAGLLNYVVTGAKLDDKLAWLISRIQNQSPTAIRLGKRAFHAMQDMPLAQSLEYAQLMLGLMAQTDDAREGMEAFLEKRPPIWKTP